MDYREAIEAEIERLKGECHTPSGYDTWDHEKIWYLETVRDRLASNATPKLVYEQLKSDYSELKETVAAEEAHQTFDWYDDHYYAKLCSGRLQACEIAIKLYEDHGKSL